MNKKNAIFCNAGKDVFNADAVVSVSKSDSPTQKSVLVCLLGSRTIEVLDMSFEEVMDTILMMEEAP